MSENADFQKAQVWAERIIQERQHNVRRRQTTISNLQIAMYVIGAIIIILVLGYILRRGYMTPDPPSILDEIKSLTNQIDASGMISD